MLVGPRIEVKAIEGDALATDRYDGYPRPHLKFEAVLVHAEIGWRIAEANEARQDGEGARRKFTADHAKRPRGSGRLGLSCHV